MECHVYERLYIPPKYSGFPRVKLAEPIFLWVQKYQQKP